MSHLFHSGGRTEFIFTQLAAPVECLDKGSVEKNITFEDFGRLLRLITHALRQASVKHLVAVEPSQPLPVDLIDVPKDAIDTLLSQENIATKAVDVIVGGLPIHHCHEPLPGLADAPEGLRSEA